MEDVQVNTYSRTLRAGDRVSESSSYEMGVELIEMEEVTRGEREEDSESCF